MEPSRIDGVEQAATAAGGGVAPVLDAPRAPPVVVLTSEILTRLHAAAPNEHFTLGWLMGMLDKRSFGLIMLMCAVIAVVRGVSIFARLLLIILAVQMIEGRPAPAFPDGLADRLLPAKHLATVIARF
ncbi:MAG: exopolysaccharide biosynthesis protein, partial [Xanthobacteraceae bacterium]|nr:exopolysaccharide biosynthesis protein [Xanthobacteraceae bacterium]